MCGFNQDLILFLIQEYPSLKQIIIVWTCFFVSKYFVITFIYNLLPKTIYNANS